MPMIIARLFRKYTSGEALAVFDADQCTRYRQPILQLLQYQQVWLPHRCRSPLPQRGMWSSPTVPPLHAEYDLSELTYIPSGSNYCTSLGFTGYSSNGTTVSATILISVTASPVSEVYSVTTKGTSVNFPANSVYSAVASATGFGLSSIQLLELPASTAGVLYSWLLCGGYHQLLTATAMRH